MNDSCHILFVLGGLNTGGAERVIVNLSNTLATNYKITFLCISSEKSQVNELEDCCHPSIHIKYLPSNLDINKIQRKILHLKQIKSEVKQIQPDIMISFMNYINIQMILISRNLGIPIIISERTDPYHYLNKNLFMKTACCCLYPLADSIVFQNKKQSLYFKRVPVNKRVVIWNPVLNTEQFPEFHYREKITNICAAGRLVVEKDYETLIRGFHIFSQKHPGVILTIYGEGTERRKLEDLVEQLHLQEKVKMPGLCRDVINKMCQADVFIMTSKFEGMPNALIEAMCLGLPCIVTDMNGIDEYVKNKESGCIIPSGNFGELADILESIAENVALRKHLGCNAKKIKSAVSADFICGKWVSLIHMVYMKRGLINE